MNITQGLIMLSWNGLPQRWLPITELVRSFWWTALSLPFTAVTSTTTLWWTRCRRAFSRPTRHPISGCAICGQCSVACPSLARSRYYAVHRHLASSNENPELFFTRESMWRVFLLGGWRKMKPSYCGSGRYEQTNKSSLGPGGEIIFSTFLRYWRHIFAWLWWNHFWAAMSAFFCSPACKHMKE